MTPEERARAIEVPWERRFNHLIVDDAELCRRIAAAIEVAVAEEREAAARVADAEAAGDVPPTWKVAATVLARKIRARGAKGEGDAVVPVG